MFRRQSWNNLRIDVAPGHDVKLHPHFHCPWQLFVLMCHEAGHTVSVSSYTQLYLSTNLDHILFNNVSWHLLCWCAVKQSINQSNRCIHVSILQLFQCTLAIALCYKRCISETTESICMCDTMLKSGESLYIIKQGYFARRRNKHPASASHCNSCESC